MPSFKALVLTLPALPDPAPAIAASRAGAVGILDLAHTRDVSVGRAALARLSRHGRGELGVKLAGSAGERGLALLAGLPESVGWAVLTPGPADRLELLVRALRERGTTILLEVTGAEEARLADAIEVDGLIAKGLEAGGWVGEETSFVLLQRLIVDLTIPVWAQGGIGLHTAAAAFAAGAAGVVLDAQLALTRESPLPGQVRDALGRFDGSETVLLGAGPGRRCRAYRRPGLPVLEDLAGLESDEGEEGESHWRERINARVGWGAPEEEVWLLGQDAALAAGLAARYRTVGGVLEALRASVSRHVEGARSLRPLAPHAPLAASHGTAYPIVQGPMTRVSDTPEFAARVAEEGALPFLALALMHAPEVDALLGETRARLGDRPWGVGILGFVPQTLRQEQIEVIRRHRPPFALIAGGRPDQSRVLEAEGIATYLHVPSPDLLRLFLESGARRFVFEGRECGGHVGPRSSFVLWEQMIEVLLAATLSPQEIGELHVLFAGGIHDDVSAAMVAALAAPLAERGARIGVLLGTAYLFTEEAVASGAIVGGFQREAIACRMTVLLDTGPGHSTRCAETPFRATFENEGRRLRAEGLPPEEVREALEHLNLGRLRIAAKAIARTGMDDPAAPRFRTLTPEEQRGEGMYMLGQIAALRDGRCTIAELHRSVSVGSVETFDRLGDPRPPADDLPTARPCDVAIVGMSCLLPGAPDLGTYWENVLAKVDAIREIPAGRFAWQRYFDPDRQARDRIYSRWGGFLDDVPFDPMRYGMPPASLPSIEPLQLLTLEVVRAALEDAGYLDRPFPRERTSVILGVGGGVADLGQQYAFRSALPMFIEGVDAANLPRLPEWTEDSFAGILLNVAAGRVANRFDLGGVNYTVDAACASSLAAVYQAARELETGTSDMVIVGGADTVQNPFGYLCFSKTFALSPTGRCRTFDESADGIVISEGLAVVVMKRLADAERDGDRIYAVLKGMAGSSDGRDKGLTAPRPEGQVRAMERAYAQAGVSPATVGLVEAHGTGTVAGDQAEIASLKQVFASAGAARQGCAVGSVKSMIGHTKCTAGVAGLVKVALALHHKVLPPTLHVTRPNPKAGFSESPFYVSAETRPWVGAAEHPRRASVSAFGFGGTNFHAVLEEHTGEYLAAPAAASAWPAELLLFQAESVPRLLDNLGSLEEQLAAGAQPQLRDLAWSLWQAARNDGDAVGVARLAIVATSLDDLRQKVTSARVLLAAEGTAEIRDPRGVYYTAHPMGREGSVAFLFPGQGSQYTDMLRDLAIHFAEIRESFEIADEVLRGRHPRRLSDYVYPPPRFGEEEERAAQRELTSTDVAQPALGAAELGMLRLLRALGVEPEMTAGHSYGEYVALHAAGVFDERWLLRISEARGRFIVEGAGAELGTMAAVEAGWEEIAEICASLDEVWMANRNGPRQTIVSGTRAGIERAVARLSERGIRAQPIVVACAFHSPLVAPARDRLAALLAEVELGAPRLAVFSNTTAAPYPRESRQILEQLADHLVRPVDFLGEVEAMYADGARIFVEVGPRGTLTSLAGQILDGRPHLALATDASGRPGLVQLQHALAQLLAHAVPADLDRLYAGRGARTLRLHGLVEDTREPPLPSTTWMVNGGSIRPHSEPPVETAAPPLRVVPVEAAAAVPAGNGNGNRTSSPKPPVPVSVPAPPADAAVSATDGDRVMLEFQGLMDRFLETQRSVMLKYLRGAPAAPDVALESLTPSADVRPTAAAPPAAAPPPAALTLVPPAPIRAPIAEERPAIPPPSGEERLTAELLTAELLRIVSERTGYPPEMLDLDASMEADLGIDSIKRVEILGALQRHFAAAGEERRGSLEGTGGIKTLRGIVTWFGSRPQSGGPAAVEAMPPSPAAEAFSGQSGGAAGGDSPPLPRFTVVEREAPPALPDPARLAGRAVVVVGDGARMGPVVVEALRAGGGRVEWVEGGPEAAAAVVERLDGLRREGWPVGGILHLDALADPMEPDIGESRRLDAGVKVLLPLARLMGPRLRGEDAGGRPWLLAAGWADTPVAGGQAGFLKTLAIEWPEVACRAVDLTPSEPPAALAAQLVQEVCVPDGDVEISLRDGRRWISGARAAPLAGEGTPALDSGSVVLITGGARGITGAVALELAECYQPTLILVGRSALPEPEESAATADRTAGRELKEALIAELQLLGEATPARVEALHARVLQDREIRKNVAAMRSAGARVRYVSVDVREESKVAALLSEIYADYGRLDAVIHGAGVIEDRLVEEKTAGSFARVFDTKVEGALALVRHLRPESLRFLVFFTSVAGRFGNRGQADYAAANEALSRLAAQLDARWPARVVSIDWGPWDSGMASPEVQERFAERGVQVIGPAAGRRAFVRELELGRPGESRVILGGGPWQDGADGAAAASRLAAELPLLAGAEIRRGVGGDLEVVRLLDPDQDLYLRDHLLDGRPVLPAAMALELMAETALASTGGGEVVGVEDFRVLHGIVLESAEGRQIVVRASESTAPVALGETRLALTITDASGRRCYQADVVLGRRLAPPSADGLEAPLELSPFPMSVDEAYQNWLFHGPLFQGIRRIDGMGEAGMRAIFAASSPRDCLRSRPLARWVIDPVLVDSAFQLAILWERANADMTPLPARFRSLRRHAHPAEERVECDFRVTTSAGGHVLQTGITLLDPDGRVLLRIDEMEFSCSRALNRLAGHPLQVVPA